MERLMQIAASGAGVRFSGSGFGVTLSAGIHIAVKNAPDDLPTLISVSNSLSLGSKSGSFVGSLLYTDWFPVATEQCPWVAQPLSLVGQTIHVELKGTVLYRGAVDLLIEAFDSRGHVRTKLRMGNIPTRGIQAASTGARGVAQQNTILYPEPETDSVE